MLELNTFVQCTWALTFLLLAAAILGKPTFLSHYPQKTAQDNLASTAETTTSTTSHSPPTSAPDPLLAAHLASGLQMLGDLVQEMRRSNDGVRETISRVDALASSLPHQIHAVEASVQAMGHARRGEEEAKRQTRRLELRLSVQNHVEKRLARIEAQLRAREDKEDKEDDREGEKKTEEREMRLARATEARDAAVLQAEEEARALASRARALREQNERELRGVEEARDTAIEACRQTEARLQQEALEHVATKAQVLVMNAENEQLRAQNHQAGEMLQKALQDLSTAHDECQETKKLAKEASKKRRRLYNKCKAREEEARDFQNQIDSLKKLCEPLPLDIPLPPSPIIQPTQLVAKPYDRIGAGSDTASHPAANFSSNPFATATATTPIFRKFTAPATISAKNPFAIDYNFNTARRFQFSTEADQPAAVVSPGAQRGKSPECSSPSQIKSVGKPQTGAGASSSSVTSSALPTGVPQDHAPDFREDEEEDGQINQDHLPARSQLCPEPSFPDTQKQHDSSHLEANQQGAQASNPAQGQFSVIPNPEAVPHTRYSKAWFEEWREHITTGSNIDQFAREILVIDETDDSNEAQQPGWMAQVKALEEDMEMKDFLQEDTSVAPADEKSSFSKQDVLDMVFNFFQDVVWVEFRKDYSNVAEDEFFEFYQAFEENVEGYMEAHPADAQAVEPTA